ncbi:MAG: RNA polymerase sigma factor RpoD, partial [Chromatiales bacterium]|nr:RNA polymerase sigma factor RpoD [Chromatiales bacterium]
MSDKQTVKPDDRASQLKLLIARGKEQGYLTYAEVNDHLPNDIVDPEQIEDIVNMINDMGITVYEKAPDAEALLLSDNAVSDDDDTDDAAAALATLDSEFGRTTDPVRMYMREMGTVELLTREGEIRIAKRIEEGLNQVKGAIGLFPPTYQRLLTEYAAVEAGEARLLDVMTGFIDPNAEDAPPGGAAASSDDDEDEVVDTGPDLEEVKAAMNSIASLYKRSIASIEKHGVDAGRTMKLREQLNEEFMLLKLSPKMFDRLVQNLRDTVRHVRAQERHVMYLCVRQAGMPRKDFISSF